MVGRDDELLSLFDAFHRAVAGEPQVALVTGEAGMGKTRLVRELVAKLPEDTVVALGTPFHCRVGHPLRRSGRPPEVVGA